MAGKAARPSTPRSLLPQARAQRAHRRARQRGQIIPLVALLMIVLTGFTALAIDAGVGYSHSRDDQDVADAAALAGSYWVFQQSAPTTTKLTGAYTAATNVAGLDCSNSSCPLTLTFYNASGYVSADQVCQATSASSSCLNDDIESGSYTVSYVGASVSATQVDYFANVDPSGSRSYTVNNQAVAEVSSTGSSSGSTSTSPMAACEMCILGDVYIGSQTDKLEASGGSIDIDGYLEGDSSTQTVQTSNGYGIDIAGQQQSSSKTVNLGSTSNFTIEASGFLGIQGSVALNRGAVIKTDTGTKANLVVTGSVSGSGSFSPSTYSTALPTGVSTLAFSDPLASTSLPSTSGLTNCGAWPSVQSEACSSPASTTCAGNTTYTLSPGIYTSITMGTCSGATLDFNPGLYVIAGGSVAISDTTDTITSPSGGVQFYFTCASGGSPTACGGSSAWNASTATCSSTADGAYLTVSAQSSTINITGGYDGSDITFLYDPCDTGDSSGSPYGGAVYWVSSSTMTQTGSGGLWAHSGTLSITSSNGSIPGPLVLNNIYLDSTGITVGTASGSLSLGTPSPAAPGGLIH